MENVKEKDSVTGMQERRINYQRKHPRSSGLNIEKFTKNTPETFLLPLKPQFIRCYIIVLLITLIICIFSFIKLRIAG